MNQPIQEIYQLFKNENPKANIINDILWYSRYGVFRSDGRIALLARSADTRTPESYEGESDKWGNGDHNAWFVAYCSGDLRSIYEAIKTTRPHYPYLIWGRSKWVGERYRIVDTKQFLNKIKQIINRHGKS